MSWVARLLRRKRMEELLDKELRYHLEQHTADLIAQGYSPEEARRRARITLGGIGGPEQVKEECRDARGTRWAADALQDAAYAIRTLRQNPGFAVVALLTLTLGIGSTTVMFTVVNSVLLKPYAFRDPDRLLNLHEQTEKANQFGNLWAFAYPNFLDCQRDSKSLDLAAWRFNGGTLSSPGDPEFVDAHEISAGFFSLLGVSLARGREFRSEEDYIGATPVAMISYDVWQNHFGGRPEAIGSPLVFEGRTYTVIGVTSPGLRLWDQAVDVFTPLGQNEQPRMRNREIHPGLQALARLRTDVSLAHAQSELALIGRRLADQYPKSNAGRTFIAESLRPDVGDVRSTLWLLFGAVSLVLLIACANIASLLLARAVSRERELAMRAALGAGRGRLVRQCLTESAVLGISGGAFGVGLAALGLRPFVKFWPGSLPRVEEITLDWHVLIFALGISLLSGVLFGIAPALRAPARNLEQALRSGARTVAGSSRRLHGAFVVAEIALAVVLLVSAGLLGRTLTDLSSLDAGVNRKNLLITRVALSPPTLSSPAYIQSAWQQILDRVRLIPGVDSVAMVDTVPMRQGINEITYWPNAAVPPRDDRPIALATSVTPDYLKVTGLALRRGRFFTDLDRNGNAPVVIIDDVLAQKAFGDQDPVDKPLWLPEMGPDPLLIVGVVHHVRHWGLAGDDQATVRAQIYYPFAQVPDDLLRRWSQLMSIAVRTNMDTAPVVEPLRRAVRGNASDQVLYEIQTMEQLTAASLARQRFLLLLFGIFGALALLLACIGIYGVLAYLTGQRVPEIGVRLALGASISEVKWMVIRESLGMILLGVVAGGAGGFAAARLLMRTVEGVRSTEPATFALMVGTLMAAALIASYVPARRASRVDPMRALRQE